MKYKKGVKGWKVYDLVGDRLGVMGYVKIVEELDRHNGRRMFKVKCEVCRNEEVLSQVQIDNGNSGSCSCDKDDWTPNI